MITKRCIYNGPSAKAGYNPSHEERVNLIIDQANSCGIDLRGYRYIMMASRPGKLQFTVYGMYDGNSRETTTCSWKLETSYKTFTTKEDATL